MKKREEIKKEEANLENDIADRDDDDSRDLPSSEEILQVDERKNNVKIKTFSGLEKSEKVIKTENEKSVNKSDKSKRRLKTEYNKAWGGLKKRWIISQWAKEKTFEMDKLLSAGFVIRELTPKEQVEHFEKKKNRASYRNKQFKCTLCYQGFLDQLKLDLHMQRHQKESGSHECYICKKREKQRNRLKQHMKLHNELYSCKQCNMITNSRSVAFQHLKKHSGSTFKCPHCPEVFVHHSTYLTHRRLRHVNEHVCEQCGYTFLNEKGIYVHKYKMHGNEKPILEGPHCAECNVKFLSQEAYDRHLGLSSKHTSNKTDEQPAHEGKIAKQPITCEVCGVIVFGKFKYTWHCRRVHPELERFKERSCNSSRELLCDTCGKVFANYYYLRDHMSLHLDEKFFQCVQCRRCFKTRISLLTHEKTHRPDYKLHKCEECGKTFSFLSNLRRHANFHNRRKTYKCEHCDKVFYWVDGLKIHKNHIHNKVPWPKRDRPPRLPKSD